MSALLLAALLAVGGGVGSATAVTAPPAAPRRPFFTLHLAGLGLLGGGDVQSVREYEEFRETARLRHTLDAAARPGAELGLTFAVSRRVGLALAATAAGGKSDAALEASLPHPLFFGTPRLVTVGTEKADRGEMAVHVGPVLFFRAGRTDLELGAGLTWLKATVDVAQTVRYDHEYPYDEVAVREVVDRRLSGSGIGFHVAAAASRRLGDKAGLFAGLRFTKADAVPEGEGTRVDLTAGGPQAALGLRFYF